MLRDAELITAAIGPGYARTSRSQRGSYDGYPADIVTVTTPLPLIGLIGIPNGLEVHGHAAIETLHDAIRAAGDGSAALEFITAGFLLLIPLVYLILAMAALQGGALSVEGASRQAARVFVQAPSSARRNGSRAKQQSNSHSTTSASRSAQRR